MQGCDARRCVGLACPAGAQQERGRAPPTAGQSDAACAQRCSCPLSSRLSHGQAIAAVLCGLWGVAGCVWRARALSFCQRSLVSFSHILPKSSYVRTMPQPQTLCRVVPASPDNVTAACPVHLECLNHYPHVPQTHADNSHSTQGASADNCARSSGEACRRRVARLRSELQRCRWRRSRPRCSQSRPHRSAAAAL